jgi:SAM-dependent methyltransferase
MEPDADLPTRTGGGRQQFLDQARAAARSVGKRSFVVEQCRGKVVLDIGCVDHDAENAFAAAAPWLHREIVDVAASTLGLDMLTSEVERLVAAGFDVVVGDAEHFDLGRTFDVVVGADIVEHLTDLGSFLGSVRQHLAPGGRFVLTTPNATAAARFAQALVRNELSVNQEHTLWLEPSVTYELLTRHGFEPCGFAWLHDEASTGSMVSKVLDRLTEPVLRRRPLLRRAFGVVALAA